MGRSRGHAGRPPRPGPLAPQAGPVTVTLVSVTSDQRDRDLGQGDIPNDIQRWTTGTDDRSGHLRAERFRTARIYTLTYRAQDQAASTATCQTTVRVPR